MLDFFDSLKGRAKRPGPFAVSYCFAALYYFFMVLAKLSFRVTMRLKAPGFLESGVK